MQEISVRVLHEIRHYNVCYFSFFDPFHWNYSTLLKRHNCFCLSYQMRSGNICFPCSFLVSPTPSLLCIKKLGCHIIAFLQHQRNIGFLFLLAQEPQLEYLIIISMIKCFNKVAVMALKLILAIDIQQKIIWKKRNMGQRCIRMIFLDSLKLSPHSFVDILVVKQ